MIPYPPYIDNSLPAFSNMVKIPFKMNPAVTNSMVKAFAIKISTLQNDLLGVQKVNANSTMFTNNYVNFALDSKKINMPFLGHYKIQLAYLDGTETNYQNLSYSDVGIIKRTYPYSQGVWQDGGSQFNNLRYNSFSLLFTTQDINEPVYKYRFQIFEFNGNKENLFFTQDWQLHNTEEDKIYIQQKPVRNINLFFTCNKNYKNNKKYKVVCEIETLNGATFNSTSNTFLYKSLGTTSAIPNIAFSYFQNHEEKEQGVVKINILLKTNAPAGNYFIKRCSSKDNYTTWENIYSFKLLEINKTQRTIVHLDSSIEQGITYYYSLVKYNNNNIVTNETFYIINKSIVYQTVDFEYIFLSDKDYNLKLKFNPQVSSFKETIQENQIVTLGNQYPFFFRNGNVKYKEFPVSGLISYLMDDYETFVKKDEIGIDKEQGYSQYSVENYCGERQFKMKVLDWLNNGKPKLFRSATEGNFIVRLTNISLSPFQGTGNLLHTFSANAIEIEDFENFNKLKELNLVL